jgi:uncharacterized protein
MKVLLHSVIVVVTASFLTACNQKADESKKQTSPEVQQRISALRGAYSAFNRGDYDAAVQALDPNVEWTEPAEFPGGGTYHGPQAVKQYLTKSRAAWAEITSEPEQFIPAGDRIVVFVHARLRANGSSDWQESRLADVYLFRDGKVIQMRAFANRQDALQWAGAAPPSN